MIKTMNADFLIIGAGIVGLTIAEELKARNPKSKIIVLEKEDKIGLHSSGRNSGVMHSGIYYPAGSIKAKLCGMGAKEMVAWCEDRNLPVNRIGKVIVPVGDGDDVQIDLLLERAKLNSVNAVSLTESELEKIEPATRSISGRAIYCPETSVIDPKAVLLQKSCELKGAGVSIVTSSGLFEVDAKSKILKTKESMFSYGHVINAAGLHADSVAHAFGVAKNLTLLPFKGMYWKLSNSSQVKPTHLIYPVPDLRVPFLGVHTTTTIDGSVYLGPSAAPAFGRENYHGLKGVNLKDGFQIGIRLVEQFCYNNQGFRNLVRQESPKYLKRYFYASAKKVVPKLKIEDLLPCLKVGIRAQMLDIEKKELVTDFLIVSKESQTHVLNAISPAFTSSMPFAKMIVDKITKGEIDEQLN